MKCYIWLPCDIDLQHIQRTNITLHLKADDPRYTTVSIYKLGESAMTDMDVTQKDPSINLDITSKDTTFVIRVTNYQGITRNYQLLKPKPPL